MKIDYTGRNIDITQGIRDFTDDRLRKLTKLLDEPTEAHVVLFVEKHRHVAEVQLKSRAGVFSGQEETGDLYASINEAIDKVERQIRRHKDKRTSRRRDARRTAEVAVAISEEATEGAEETPADDEADLPRRILRSARYRLKPLTPEDAVLELETSGEDVLVFRDSLTYRVNVVHRLRDGSYGLVDPEF